MTKIEYYTKNKKVYHYEPTAAEAEEIRLLRKKQLKARSRADKRAQDEYEEEHLAGYCPCCFLLRPATGICPTCEV